MSASASLRSIIFAFAVFCLTGSTLCAQNEVARERSSLKGIQEMGFTVNLESNLQLNKQSELDVTSLVEMGREVLRNGNISLIPDQEVKQSADIPFLYLHINSMEAGQGLIPFALTLYFYQPVKLSLNRDLKTSAVTWESGSVGIVSYNNIKLIREASRELLKEFISDYNQVNSSN